MRIEPRRNLTVTLLRRNALGPARLRGACPRARVVLARAVAAASRSSRDEARLKCEEQRSFAWPCVVETGRTAPPDVEPHRPVRARADWPIYGPPLKCWTGRILDVMA